MKKLDYIIISIACFFLGIFVVSQFYSGITYKNVLQPENNEVMALEVAKLTASNADLRQEVKLLTSDYNSYSDKSENSKNVYNKYQNEIEKYDTINGGLSKTGQGVSILIYGKMSPAQMIDFINAIKNIGGELISINDSRLIINTDIAKFANLDQYEIKVLGNSSLFKSALERKGGIIEQIQSKDLKIFVNESDKIVIPPSANIPKLIYSKILQ